MRCGEDRKCVVRDGAPRCVCSPQCHLKHKAPVCGSDGRTYVSECHLLKRACRKRRRLLVTHYGPCQTCSGVRCSAGKTCVLDEQLTPRCVRCPTTCPAPEKPRPICGADGRTYPSPCHLKKGIVPRPEGDSESLQGRLPRWRHVQPGALLAGPEMSDAREHGDAPVHMVRLLGVVQGLFPPRLCLRREGVPLVVRPSPRGLSLRPRPTSRPPPPLLC
ncbi:follistatin-like [Penaeus monodon]|uniref:follistatin-like n=1 Tax=Penaeus monodon TaxID=6687 RepID=UPI0018A6EEE2|nr:follistatin-like [Penaeus monodon]